MIKLQEIENGKFFKNCPNSKVTYQKLHHHSHFIRVRNLFQVRQWTDENGNEIPYEDSLHFSGERKVFLQGA
tara:strand:+ start:3099 stop:3314 length:216 start_codon:yes stop_codon:yes gene_type:complete